MISEVERFHSAVKGSAELRQGLQAASDPNNAFVAYAGSKGYTFSAGELEEWNNKKLQGELSAADLDTVTGGVYGGGAGNSLARRFRMWLADVDGNF